MKKTVCVQKLSALDHLLQTPLLVPSQHVLLRPRDRPPDGGAQHAQCRCEQLEDYYQGRDDAKRAQDAGQHAGLVEVVLRLDQISRPPPLQVEHGHKREVGAKEWKGPYAHELVQGDVEDEVIPIVG